jgi:hypothetical protein
MALDLEKIVPSPYFRTYWIQQNITEMKQYSAAVSDLFRSAGQYREERVLIRKNAAPTASEDASAAVADLVRFAPVNRGIYEAKALPSGQDCFHLLQAKILAPHLGAAPASRLAPQVQLTNGETGQSSDLETRIDQAPTSGVASNQGVSGLEQLLSNTKMLASLQVQSTEGDPAGVFVRIHSGIVLAAATEWNDADVRSALVGFVSPGFTTSELGVSWQQKPGYAQLDGLWPLSISVKGKYLFVSDDARLLEKMLPGERKPGETSAVMIAGFNHANESSNFRRFSSIVDRNAASEGFPPSREPQFFSENMVSLSQMIANVSREEFVERNEGNAVLQFVTYDWRK